MYRADNGKEFTDRLFGLRKRAATGAHAFDALCADLDIDHRLTPPKSPQTNGMVERFNGRIEEVLQSHHFRSGEDLETTLHRYVWLYNQQFPQSALSTRTPLQAMKDWHKLKPELFKKQPYYLPGCDMWIKPPERLAPRDEIRAHVVSTDWHQDRGVTLESADDTGMVTVWLAITDATVENGCLQVKPGIESEMIPHCALKQTGIIEKFLPRRAAVPVPVPVRAGGAGAAGCGETR